MEKIPVKVIAEFSRGGKIRPLCVIWDDDRHFEITHILKVDHNIGWGGVHSNKYTCIIKGREKLLYLDDYKIDKRLVGGKWYVIRE